MKAKDIDWMQDKIQDIKKRKRKLKLLQDPTMVKKIKADLKREYRATKRSEKNYLKEWIKKQID
jgi:hypothetical protein